MPRTSPTISSLLSTLKAPALQFRSVVLIVRVSPAILCPANALELGPWGLLMQAVLICPSVVHSASHRLQVTNSVKTCGSESAIKEVSGTMTSVAEVRTSAGGRICCTAASFCWCARVALVFHSNRWSGLQETNPQPQPYKLPRRSQSQLCCMLDIIRRGSERGCPCMISVEPHVADDSTRWALMGNSG